MYPPRENIEMLKYNRSDEQCVAWLNKVQDYFDIYNIMMDEEKVKYVPMHLEGDSYNWYIWWKGDNFSFTWKLLKNDFLKRVQGITEDKFFSNLTRLQEKGSVEEFTHQWESLATRVLELSDKQ